MQTKYVVDTTILVSWLLDPGKLTGKIVKSLELELSTPYKGVDELWEHGAEWTKRRPDFDLQAFTDQVSYYVRTAMPKEYAHKMPDAKSIMDPIDSEDAEFLALAMAQGLPVWSHDPHFKKQSKVLVVTSTHSETVGRHSAPLGGAAKGVLQMGEYLAEETTPRIRRLERTHDHRNYRRPEFGRAPPPWGNSESKLGSS